MMDLDAARRGDENVSTPREMARLAEIVAREGLPPARASDMLGVASIPDEARPSPRPARRREGDQQAGGPRGRALRGGPGRRPRPALLPAIMTAYLRREADGEAAIAEISSAVYGTFDRLARPASTAASSASATPRSRRGATRPRSARGRRRSRGGG